MLFKPFTFTIKIVLLVLAVAAILVMIDRAGLSLHALQRVDPLPKAQALVADEKFAEADAWLDFFMEFDYVRDNAQAVALHAHIKDKRDGLLYQAGKAITGFVKGESDETIGQVSGVVSDFLVFGDVRDLGVQGWNYVTGEEVDEVLLVLSTAGVAATGAQVASAVGTATTAGAATPALAGSTAAKSALVTLKTAKRLGKLPNWLLKELKMAAVAVKQSKSFGKLGELFDDIGTLARTRGGLELLSKTDNADDLRKMAKFSRAFEGKSIIMQQLARKNVVEAAQNLNHADDLRALRVAATYGDEGVATMKRMGGDNFLHALSKKSHRLKFLYKHAPVWLLKWLALLPLWLLVAIAAIGVGVCLPWLRRLLWPFFAMWRRYGRKDGNEKFSQS